MRFLYDKLKKFRYKRLLDEIHTDLDDAVEIINERRKNQDLIKEVESFLNNDIPEHFKGEAPIFYLSRYLATPDYETLFFIDQVKKYNYPIIIGEDPKDKVTSYSSLKRNLLKLPIIVGESKNGAGIIQYRRVADQNSEQGKSFEEAMLLNGKKLTNLHTYLTKKLFPKNVRVVDESGWVNRHHRGELIELYEYMLALLLVHGIMLEVYEPDEIDFVQQVVLPAMKKTEKRFGHKPLLAPLVQKPSAKIADINSYPKNVLKHLDEFIEK